MLKTPDAIQKRVDNMHCTACAGPAGDLYAMQALPLVAPK